MVILTMNRLEIGFEKKRELEQNSSRTRQCHQERASSELERHGNDSPETRFQLKMSENRKKNEWRFHVPGVARPCPVMPCLLTEFFYRVSGRATAAVGFRPLSPARGGFLVVVVVVAVGIEFL